MGFFDDVLKKVGAALATRYGVVSEGKYAGCHIALGNPPKEKVTDAYSFSQVIFLNDKEETARLNILTGILDVEYTETIQFPATGNNGYRCTVTYINGETSEVDFYASKIRILYRVFGNKMLKETQGFFEEEIEKLPQA